MILEKQDKPTIIRVTTDWLLLHQPNRHKCKSYERYVRPLSVERAFRLREFLKQPRTQHEIADYFNICPASVRPLLHKVNAKCISRSHGKKPGIWTI